MATIHHQIEINAPVTNVYAALSSAESIGTWWDTQTPIQTEQGLVLEHNPGSEHGVVKLRVVEMLADKRIEWECISTHPQSSPASAWTGTHFLFELTGSDGTTTISFRQTGYPEQSAFSSSNETAWGELLQNLKQVVES